MKKILFTLALSLFISAFHLHAQNGVDIEAMTSPQVNFNYDSASQVDINVIVQNDGGEKIFANDSFLIDLTVSYNDTISQQDSSVTYNLRIRANTILSVGETIDLTLYPNYPLDSIGIYSICAQITGTVQYPVNLTKFSEACANFTVNLKEAEKPQLQNVFYQNGKIQFQTNINRSGTIEIFDLSGKRLYSSIQPIRQKNVISFKAPANGFYFLRLSPESGLSKTTKFVVH